MDLQCEAPAARDAPPWPARLELSNGRSHGVDLVISAIGVEVRSAWLPAELERCAEDGGILVDACASLLMLHKRFIARIEPVRMLRVCGDEQVQHMGRYLHTELLRAI